MMGIHAPGIITIVQYHPFPGVLPIVDEVEYPMCQEAFVVYTNIPV
jgi:hypothetical protein